MRSCWTREKREAFCTILREELQLATGCTEPIAVAYCVIYVGKWTGGEAPPLESPTSTPPRINRGILQRAGMSGDIRTFAETPVDVSRIAPVLL